MSCWLIACSIVTCALLLFRDVNSAALRRLTASNSDVIDDTTYDYNGAYCFGFTLVISAMFAIGICIATIATHVMSRSNEKQVEEMEATYLTQRDKAEELRLKAIELEKLKTHLDAHSKELCQLKRENMKRVLQIIANTEQMLPEEEKIVVAQKKRAQDKVKSLEQNVGSS